MRATLLLHTSIRLRHTEGEPLHSLSRSSAIACALAVSASTALAEMPDADIPSIPLPPLVEGLIGMPQTYSLGRQVHLETIRREAGQAGLPPDVADAVAQVESAYNPGAVGGVGEVGLMQIRPTTAAMLGYRGTLNGLFEPETNIRYGVMYLARAWHLTGGDLCRALMKYRAGHGEERMTPLSVEYCRRARMHLATIGSPLGDGAAPLNAHTSLPFGRMPKTVVKATITEAVRTVVSAPARSVVSASAGAAPVLLPQRPSKGRRIAAAGPPSVSPAEAHYLALLREKQYAQRARIRQMWAAHETRMRIISARLRPESLRIASGI